MAYEKNYIVNMHIEFEFNFFTKSKRCFARTCCRTFYTVSVDYSTLSGLLESNLATSKVTLSVTPTAILSAYRNTSHSYLLSREFSKTSFGTVQYGIVHAGGDVLVSRIRDLVRMGREVEVCWEPL